MDVDALLHAGDVGDSHGSPGADATGSLARATSGWVGGGGGGKESAEQSDDGEREEASPQPDQIGNRQTDLSLDRLRG